jgi:hypothetical protein
MSKFLLGPPTFSRGPTVVRGPSVGYRWYKGSTGSSVDIATSYGLDGRVRFPVGASDFSLPHTVQTDSGAHKTSYPKGTGGSFPEVIAAEE